jgi:hypothetical protein
MRQFELYACNREAREGCFREDIYYCRAYHHMRTCIAEKWTRVVRQEGDVCPLSSSTSEWEAQNEIQMERKVSRRNQHQSYWGLILKY